MASSSKRQQTAAKRNREQALRERRERKQEKKDARAAARAAGEDPFAPREGDEAFEDATSPETQEGPQAGPLVDTT